MILFRGMIKPAAGYRPLAYSSPEAVHTTETIAVIGNSAVSQAKAAA
jgi:hypothetical protein